MRSPQNNQSHTTLPLYTVAYCCEATKEQHSQHSSSRMTQTYQTFNRLALLSDSSTKKTKTTLRIITCNGAIHPKPNLRIPSMIPHDGFPIADLRYPSCWAINLPQLPRQRFESSQQTGSPTMGARRPKAQCARVLNGWAAAPNRLKNQWRSAKSKQFTHQYSLRNIVFPYP